MHVKLKKKGREKNITEIHMYFLPGSHTHSVPHLSAVVNSFINIDWIRAAYCYINTMKEIDALHL